MENLRAKIQFTIYNQDMNIVYDTDFVIKGLRELGDVQDIIRTDYMDVVEEQDRRWSTTERRTLLDQMPRRTDNPDNPGYKWWDHLK